MTGPASWDDDSMEMQPCEALVSEDVGKSVR